VVTHRACGEGWETLGPAQSASTGEGMLGEAWKPEFEGFTGAGLGTGVEEAEGWDWGLQSGGDAKTGPGAGGWGGAQEQAWSLGTALGPVAA